MDKKLLGKRINATRKEAGLTGERLAEACNINATYLRQIEGGTKTPSLPVFILLCRELKVSPSYLLCDYLEDAEIQDMDILFNLWRKATPNQIRLMTSMLRSALDTLPDREEALHQ